MIKLMVLLRAESRQCSDRILTFNKNSCNMKVAAVGSVTGLVTGAIQYTYCSHLHIQRTCRLLRCSKLEDRFGYLMTGRKDGYEICTKGIIRMLSLQFPFHSNGTA